MIKIKTLNKNAVVVLFPRSGARVLFSYEIPVAARIDGVNYQTDKEWSSDTMWHIRQYEQEYSVSGTLTPRSQEWFDTLPEANLV